MNAAGFITAHPMAQFTKNRHFYAYYDGFWMLLSALAVATMVAVKWQPLFGAPQWWYVLAMPALWFVCSWAHLTIHNCTHGNLPKPINRLVGELLGVLVVVRFASWDIIHMRHHKFSDDREKDPHPNFVSFWKTVSNTIVMVEKQLFQQYFDTWGDTPENRKAEKRRAWVSYGANVVLLAAWFMFLGPWFFVLVFAPANLLAGLFVIHFNWSTHNADRAKTEADFRPVNLDSGYYWLGNRLFFGIYMHANHHTNPRLANPLFWDEAKLGPMEPCIDAKAK